MRMVELGGRSFRVFLLTLFIFPPINLLSYILFFLLALFAPLSLI